MQSERCARPGTRPEFPRDKRRRSRFANLRRCKRTGNGNSRQRRQPDHAPPGRKLAKMHTYVTSQQEGEEFLEGRQSFLRSWAGGRLGKLFGTGCRRSLSEIFVALFKRPQEFFPGWIQTTRCRRLRARGEQRRPGRRQALLATEFFRDAISHHRQVAKDPRRMVDVRQRLLRHSFVGYFREKAVAIIDQKRFRMRSSIQHS